MGHLMNWAARLLRRLADQRLQPLGLSAGHLPVLTALIKNDGLSQKALTESAAIEQPTMANTLSRMERDGIIKRLPGGNKRSPQYTLTDETRRKVPEIQAAIRSMSAVALSGIPAEKQDDFRKMITAAIGALERATNAAEADAET